MRIIYYSPHPLLNLGAPTGFATHMREMIKAFEKQGHEVIPVIMGGTELKLDGSTTPKQSLLKKIIKAMVPSYIWESLKDFNLLRFDLHAAQTLEEAVIKYKPDLIYERFNYLQTSGGDIAKKYGIKNVVEVNAPYIEERVKYQGSSIFISKAKINELKRVGDATLLAVVSSPLKDDFVKRLKIDPNKIVVTHNAIDPDKIKTDGLVIEQLRKQYQLENKAVIGFVGSIAQWHRVDIMLTAFSKISNSYPNARLLIVGSGESLDILKQLAKSLSIADKTVFTGNVPHGKVFEHIALMDVTVLPKTDWYMSPIKLFEYGAMQKAIIAPNTGSVRDVITHEHDGLLIKPESEEEVKNAMVRLLNDNSLVKSISNNFYRKVFDDHTWYKNAESVIKRVA